MTDGPRPDTATACAPLCCAQCDREDVKIDQAKLDAFCQEHRFIGWCVRQAGRWRLGVRHGLTRRAPIALWPRPHAGTPRPPWTTLGSVRCGHQGWLCDAPGHFAHTPLFSSVFSRIETAMDTLVTKILEVAKDAGKPKATGKGSITLVTQDDAGAAPGQKPENVMDNLSQCCKT